MLLIHLEFPNTFWGFKSILPIIGKKSSMPSLGLLTVAALLPGDWEKRVIDLNIRSITSDDLAWATMAFVSGMTIQRASALKTIPQCKRAGLTVVAGGPLFYHDMESFGDVDHFVLNEGEVTLPQLLEDLKAGTPKKVYRTSAFADMQETPIPAWDLEDFRQYAVIPIQYSRGCPFRCEFCDVTYFFGHGMRTKSSAQILAELDVIYNKGWRGPIFFVDDNFIGKISVVKSEILPALILWRQGKNGIRFNTQTSINLANDPKLMEMMVAAGFDTVFIGIESLNDDVLKQVQKRQNEKRNMLEDIRRIQRAGLQVQGSFIVGFDQDTPESFDRLFHFIQEAGLVTAMVQVLQACTGTRFYERMKREGRLREETHGDGVIGTTNIATVMDAKVLTRGYAKILERLHSPENFYQRINRFFQEFPPLKYKPYTSLDDIKTLVRVIYYIGVRGSERVYFWKLFFWLLFHRIELLPTALQLVCYGHHFKIISETLVQSMAVEPDKIFPA